jgi:hypothetical protein
MFLGTLIPIGKITLDPKTRKTALDTLKERRESGGVSYIK